MACRRPRSTIGAVTSPDVAPFPRSWWVRPGRLLGSCFPGDHDRELMRERLGAALGAGVRHIICLQPEDEVDLAGRPFVSYRKAWQELAREQGHDVGWERHPIGDMDVPSAGRMRAILDAIDRESGAVLIHCWGGHGRTGTVAGCWLVRHGHAPAEALARIEEARRGDEHLCQYESPQTREQVAMIHDWAERERG